MPPNGTTSSSSPSAQIRAFSASAGAARIACIFSAAVFTSEIFVATVSTSEALLATAETSDVISATVSMFVLLLATALILLFASCKSVPTATTFTFVAAA